MTDISYCSSDCINKTCERNLKHGGYGEFISEKPISMIDFSSQCKDYKKVENESRT